MKEIKCPNCGTVITVDDADFAAILNQVRTEEFDAEVNRRIEETKQLLKAEEAKKLALEAAEAAKEAAKLDARHKEDLSKKELEIEKLRQQIAGWEQGKTLELEAVRFGRRRRRSIASSPTPPTSGKTLPSGSRPSWRPTRWKRRASRRRLNCIGTSRPSAP